MLLIIKKLTAKSTTLFTSLTRVNQIRHLLCDRACNGELEMNLNEIATCPNATLPASNPRIEAGIPFVESLARRMAASMPHSIDLSDLVQDGVIGLIDAAQRFDDSRGIKFETFAERRIRGAMIDALRKDAWPRGVRRVRRELEAAREKLRASLGHEPSLADLANEIGSDEKRLGKTIVRLNTIESTSPFCSADHVDEAHLPAVMVPTEPERPDLQYERNEVKNRVRNAIATLPPREQRVIAMYYYDEATMKDIGTELGVNESRVSQLHARAVTRMREALCAETTPIALKHGSTPTISAALRAAFAAFEKPKMAKASLASGQPESDTRVSHAAHNRAALVLVVRNQALGDDQDSVSRAARSKSPNLKGLESQRHAVSSRNRSASVPATSPVTKITRRANAGLAAAMAR